MLWYHVAASHAVSQRANFSQIFKRDIALSHFSIAADRACWLTLAGLLLVSSGCDFIPERPPLVAPEKANATKLQSEAQAKLIEPPSVGFISDWESWYGYYLNGQLVGYSHTSAKRAASESSGSQDENIAYKVEEQLRFRRGRSTSVQQLEQSSNESRRGELQSFESTLKFGPLVTRYSGTVANNVLVVDVARGTDRKTRRIAWEPHFRSLVAVEQSLRRTPMKSGEKRTLKMLFPHRYRLGTIELWCTGQTGVPMLDGSYPSLFEIVSTEKIDDEIVAEQVLWTDSQGVIRKQLRSESGMMAYLMDRHSATIDSVPDGEIFEQTAVDVSGEIDDPAKASRMAFVVRTASDAVAEGKSISVPTTPGQFVRKMDGGGFQVFVDQEADEPPEGFSGTKLQPIAADEEPNAIIDSRHASIRRIATASIRGQLGDREVAMTLARTTKDLLSLTSQSKEMTRSSAIVQETVGGSTEYAIVLASLLRAKNIASRLALGIKYDPNEDVMRYHVWTIAFVDGRWISLDATEGGLAASDRITFVTTNLKDANPFNAVAATMALMGRADIEIKP